jgi:uncharacterized protein
MAKNSLAAINDFLQPKRFALVGISRDAKKFSRNVYKELSAKGFDIYPVNPNMDDIDGVKCYHDISELPPNVNRIVFMTPKSQTLATVETAINAGISHLWIQQGAETKEAVDLATQKGAKLVYGTCILMHSEPDGVHKFHGFLAKLFGAFPKN